MANGNYSVLKDNIDDYIKQNGDGDITGQVLQTQLFAMITSLGAGYQFMGVAKLTPTPTDPGSPDQNVFYVAFQPGIYSNFGNQTVADGEIAILKWNGSWTKEVTGAASAAKLDELGHEVDGYVGHEYDSSEYENCLYDDSGTWFASPTYNGYALQVSGGEIFILTAQAGYNAVYAFVKVLGTNGQSVQYATGASRIVLPAGTSAEITAPGDAKYLWLCHLNNNIDRTPGVVSTNKFVDLGTRLNGLDTNKLFPVFTRGYINCDNTNHKLVVSANITLFYNNTQYIIPANTQVSYSFTNVVTLWKVVFNTDQLTLNFVRWDNASFYPVLFQFYATTTTKIISICNSVVPVRIDNYDIQQEVINLENTPRFVPVGTRGYIDCNNVEKKFVVSANIVVRIGGVSYTIPAGAQLPYDWTTESTTLYKVCVDTGNLTIKLFKIYDDTTYPVLFVFYGYGISPSLNRVDKIVSSIIPIKINGYGLEEVEDEAGFGRDQDYTGEKIEINSNKFKRKQVTLGGTIGQSFASYDDYIVTCNYDDGQTPSVVTAKVISISGGNVLATLTLPYGSVHRPHCNVCCFGKEFGSANSIVPLLYVSQWDCGYERGVLVYDITLSGGVYSASLVQTILPDNIGTNYLGAGDVDWVVDTDNSMLYALAYYLAGPSTLVEGNKEMVCKFALPELADGALVQLTEADILDSWEMEMFNYSQDKCYNSGKIFVLSGESSYPQWTKIRVIDLARKEIVSVIPLDQYGGEPEGIDIVTGFLSYSYSGAAIYRLIF